MNMRVQWRVTCYCGKEQAGDTTLTPPAVAPVELPCGCVLFLIGNPPVLN